MSARLAAAGPALARLAGTWGPVLALLRAARGLALALLRGWPGLALALLLGTTAAAHAASSADLLQADRTTVKEHVDDQELVSGGHVVGAGYLAPGDTVQPDRLYVHLPRPAQGVLRLEVTTVDARYGFAAEYPLDEPTQGWKRLEYPSREKERLRDRPPGEVAVRAYLVPEEAAGKAAEHAPPLLLVRWGALGDAPTIALFVNSERSETLYVTGDGRGGFRQESCRRIGEGSTLKFDTVCEVAAARLPDGQPLTLFRRRGNSRLPQLDVRLDR